MNYKIVAAVAVIIVCSLGLYIGLSGDDEPTKEPGISWEETDEDMFWEFEDLLIEDEEAFEHAVGALFDDASVENHVFPASIDLGNGETSVGLAISNLEYGYSSDTGEIMFGSAFVPLLGQPTADPEEASEGLVIIPLSEQVDGFGYLYTYGLEPYIDHYVRDGSYVKYGINEDGGMIFETTKLDVDGSWSEYMESLTEVCDTSIGSLYSYDEDRWLLDYSMGGDTDLRSSFLWEEVDYDAILKEVRGILDSQEQKFFNYTVETNLYYSQEAVNAFLLSLQEETFMGYKVEDLIKASEELDPNEFIRVTSDGLMVQEIPPPVATPSGLVKWLTGMFCAMAVAISVIVQACVPMAFPVTGAIIGSAIDVFGQVVLFNTALENIDWTGVMVSAVAGSISAIPGVGFLGDVAINGAAEAAYSALSGGTGEEVLASFGIGLGAGLLFGGAMKAVGGVNKLVHNRVHVGETIDLKPLDGGYTKIDADVLEDGIGIDYITKETYQTFKGSSDGFSVDNIRSDKIDVTLQSVDTAKWQEIDNHLLYNNDVTDDYLLDLIEKSDKKLNSLTNGRSTLNDIRISGPEDSIYVNHVTLCPNNGNMPAYHVHYREMGQNVDTTMFLVQHLESGDYKIKYEWVQPGSITTNIRGELVSKTIRTFITVDGPPSPQLMERLASISDVKEFKEVITDIASDPSSGVLTIKFSHDPFKAGDNLENFKTSIWKPYEDTPEYGKWVFESVKKAMSVKSIITTTIGTRMLSFCSV